MDLPTPFNTWLPGSNSFDIPDLALSGQLLSIPLNGFERWHYAIKYHAVSHFYCHDSRFARLLRNPSLLPESGLVATIEVNNSVSEFLPKALALYQVYRRRWISSYWQGLGVKIVADISLPRRHLDLALMGLPRGWRSYSTRAWRDDPSLLLDQWRLALRHSHPHRPLFFAFGGRWVETFSKKYGFYWVPLYGSSLKAMAAIRG